MGAAAGPLPFLAGERLGAVTRLPPLTYGLLRLSVSCTVALLVFSVAARRVAQQQGDDIRVRQLRQSSHGT